MHQVHFRGQWLPVGTHVRIKRPSGIAHHAIVVSGCASSVGPTLVMDNAKACGVSDRILEEIAASDPVEVVACPQSAEHADIVINRAYSQKGTGYDLLIRNCEHFATSCMTNVSRSDQLATCAAVVLGAVVLGYILTADK